MAPGAGILGDPGSGWSPDVLVSQPSEAQRNASIGADHDGVLHVAYESYSSSWHQNGICVTDSHNGGILWDSTSCDWISVESYGHPSIAVNFAGNEALVVFESSGGGLRLMTHFPSMNSCCQILTTDPGDHNPSITFSRDGFAFAFLTFERDDGVGGYDLMFTAARDSGVWSAWEAPQTLVGGLDHSVNRMPRIAWGDPSYVYIVYERQAAPGNRDVLLMRSAAGGIPGSWMSEPGAIVVATAADEFASDVAAVSDSGKVIVPFAQSEAFFNQIYVAYSEDWGNMLSWSVFPLTTDPGGHENPRVVAIPVFNMVRLVYWSPLGVFASTALASSLSSWTSPVRITDSAARLTPVYELPAIASYPYGSSWYTGVVWTDYRGGLPICDIYFSRNQTISFPDLIPTLIEIVPPPPLLNNTVTQVNVTVANLGDISAGGFDLLLFDDKDGDMTPDAGENISLSSLTGLLGHSQTDVSFNWTASPMGNHSLCTFADSPPSKVIESDELNNIACTSAEVFSLPDYLPTDHLPSSPVKTGLSLPLQLSVQVFNQGDGSASAPATVAFYNVSSPAVPFAAFTVPPLNQFEISSRFTATWTSPATPGTRRVAANVDYHDDITESNETNNVYTWTIEVVAGPVTSLAVGSPNHTSPALVMYVRSSTPLDLSVVDQSGTGINHTWYRIDNVTWTEYSSYFFLSGDGYRYVEWYSEDNVGNVEDVSWRVLRVDDTPPATAISIGEPKCLTGGNFVKSSTPLALSAADGGVGSNSTFYRLWGGSWSPWRDYSTSFSLAGRDGTWYVEFLSFDYLGNMEAVRNETLILDNTPPVTTISPAAPFTLTATDEGCGVNVTMYTIDGGSWMVYTGGFTLTEGEHTIYYHSIDNLGNIEQEKSLVVKPPVEVAVNYKPLVAAMFAVILVIVGVWSSRRRPWKGEKGGKALIEAFTIASLPFVLAETATGVVSLLTGQFSIPPLIGIGTAVDLIILLAGLGIAVQRALKMTQSKAEVTGEPKSR